MDHTQPFIGIGHNPNGPDLPLGFSSELAGHPAAMAVYGSFSTAEKERLVQYLQSATSGGEALQRLHTAVQQLDKGDRSFF